MYHVLLCYGCRCNTACNVCRQPACRQARHIAHTPLHLSHANQRSNNKHNGEDHPPAAAVNTQALLELLLTQPKVDTEIASENSLLVDDTSATPQSSPTDAHLPTPGIAHQLPTPTAAAAAAAASTAAAGTVNSKDQGQVCDATEGIGSSNHDEECSDAAARHRACCKAAADGPLHGVIGISDRVTQRSQHTVRSPCVRLMLLPCYHEFTCDRCNSRSMLELLA